MKFPAIPIHYRHWPLGMAVKVEEQELADAIAAALAELKRDGSLTEIFRRHGISHTPA